MSRRKSRSYLRGRKVSTVAEARALGAADARAGRREMRFYADRAIAHRLKCAYCVGYDSVRKNNPDPRIPPLDRWSGSWMVTHPKTGKVLEFFDSPVGRRNVKKAMAAGWKVETAHTYLSGLNRKSNPVEPLASRVESSARAYQDFTGHAPSGTRRMRVRTFSVGWPLGKLDAVLYSTQRDGKREKYIHRFRSQSRPHLVVSPDGTSLGIVGGRFRVTDSGITDA